MVRTQIQLTDQQAQALKRMAVDQQSSVAEVIRRCVDDMLRSSIDSSREQRWRRAVAAVEAERFRSDKTDVSANHDRYLAEAYET